MTGHSRTDRMTLWNRVLSSTPQHVSLVHPPLCLPLISFVCLTPFLMLADGLSLAAWAVGMVIFISPLWFSVLEFYPLARPRCFLIFYDCLLHLDRSWFAFEWQQRSSIVHLSLAFAVITHSCIPLVIFFSPLVELICRDSRDPHR